MLRRIILTPAHNPPSNSPLKTKGGGPDRARGGFGAYCTPEDRIEFAAILALIVRRGPDRVHCNFSAHRTPE